MGTSTSLMALVALRDDTFVTPPAAVDEGFGLGTCRGDRRDGLYEQPGSKRMSTRTRVWASWAVHNAGYVRFELK